MTKVGIQEAKTHFSQLIERVLNGEDIVVARHGRGLVRLVAVAEESDLRPIGLHQLGNPKQTPNQSKEPLPAEILATFFETDKFASIPMPKKP